MRPNRSGSFRRFALIFLVALGCVAGVGLVAAAFLATEGEYSMFPVDGSVVEAMPGHGVILIAAGLGIAGSLVMAVSTFKPGWALLAFAIAVAAAVSLDTGDYHYASPVMERWQTLWEMRGDGAVLAAAAAAVGAIAALAIATLIRTARSRAAS